MARQNAPIQSAAPSHRLRMSRRHHILASRTRDAPQNISVRAIGGHRSSDRTDGVLSAGDAILAALIREMRRDMLADILSAVDRGKNADLASAIGFLVDASLRHHLRNPALSEALERAESEMPLDAETQALKSDKAALIVGVLDRHGIENPRQAAMDVFAMCHGIVHTALQAGETDFDDLSDRLRRAVTGYLGAGTA